MPRVQAPEREQAGKQDAAQAQVGPCTGRAADRAAKHRHKNQTKAVTEGIRAIAVSL